METHNEQPLSLDLKEMVDQLTLFFAEILDVSGEALFEVIVKQLGSMLHADTVFIARIKDADEFIVQTISLYTHNAIGKNVEFNLQNTLSFDLLNSKECYYSADSDSRFLDDPIVEKFKPVVYVGIPLLDGSKKTIGIMVVLFEHPILEPDVVTNVMQIFASRTASEIERMLMKAKLAECNTHFYEIFNQSPLPMLELDLSLLKKRLLLNDMVPTTNIRREILPYIVIRDSNIAANTLFTLKLDKKSTISSKTISKSILTFMYELVVFLVEGDDSGDTVLKYVDGNKNPHELQIHWTIPRRYEQNWGKILIVVQDLTNVQIATQNLHQAEKMQSLGLLAGCVAHDFNDQLGGIMSMAETILSEIPPDSPCLSHVNGIIKAVSSSSELTDKLLTFAQQGNALNQILNVHDVLHTVLSMVSHTFDKQILIKLKFSSQPLFIFGDLVQIQNSILQLCLNAADAMPEGGTLTISTDSMWLDYDFITGNHQSIKIGDYIKVTVADTGKGISPKHLTRIFDPFFTTKEAGKGIGMGLSALYGTIKNHSGVVTVKSEVGVGTVFTLYLPQITHNDALPFQATMQLAKRYDKYHVLLVDDEEIIRESGDALLSSVGFVVVTAVNGQKAIDLMRAVGKTFDLIIMDMVMPIKNGSQAIAEIRTFNQEIPIVVCSGYSKDENIDKMIEDGANSFLRKPFRRDALLKVIDSLLMPK